MSVWLVIRRKSNNTKFSAMTPVACSTACLSVPGAERSHGTAREPVYHFSPPYSHTPYFLDPIRRGRIH
jgi:hypothetical protein